MAVDAASPSHSSSVSNSAAVTRVSNDDVSARFGAQTHSHTQELGPAATFTRVGPPDSFTAAQTQSAPDPLASVRAGQSTLAKGAKGPAVEALQKALIRHGANLEPDSDFGARTDKAVRGFQRSQGLTPDGIVGPKTLAALDKPSLADGANLAPIRSGQIVLRQGADNAEVAKVQQLLNQHGANLKVDGDFGARTKAAIESFQAANQLGIDGAVGKKTLAALENPNAKPVGTVSSPTSPTAPGKFVRPVEGRLSSGVGSRTPPLPGASSNHIAWDIAAPAGTPIRAAHSGTIYYGHQANGAGNYAFIAQNGTRGQGIETGYFHMQDGSRLVPSGTTVKAGDIIGYVGSTGNSTGPHLHFEIRKDGVKQRNIADYF